MALLGLSTGQEHLYIGPSAMIEGYVCVKFFGRQDPEVVVNQSVLVGHL